MYTVTVTGKKFFPHWDLTIDGTVQYGNIKQQLSLTTEGTSLFVDGSKVELSKPFSEAEEILNPFSIIEEIQNIFSRQIENSKKPDKKGLASQVSLKLHQIPSDENALLILIRPQCRKSYQTTIHTKKEEILFQGNDTRKKCVTPIKVVKLLPGQEVFCKHTIPFQKELGLQWVQGANKQHSFLYRWTGTELKLFVNGSCTDLHRLQLAESFNIQDEVRRNLLSYERDVASIKKNTLPWYINDKL